MAVRVYMAIVIGQFLHRTLFATQIQTQRNPIGAATPPSLIAKKNLGYVPFKFTLQLTFAA